MRSQKWSHFKILVIPKQVFFNLLPPIFPKCGLGSSSNQESYSLADNCSFTACQPSQRRDSRGLVHKCFKNWGSHRLWYCMHNEFRLSVGCRVFLDFLYRQTLCIWTLAATQGDCGKTAKQIGLLWLSDKFQ